MKNKKAQVWIETVIYTLIALALIGVALTFIQPKIEEIRDRAIIEKSMGILNDIDTVINNIGIDSPGNIRMREIKIQQGSLIFDAKRDRIFFEIKTKSIYSEPDLEIKSGNIIIKTEQQASINKVTLLLDYYHYDITNHEGEEIRKLTKAPLPYKMYISNQGQKQDKTVINLRVE